MLSELNVPFQYITKHSELDEWLKSLSISEDDIGSSRNHSKSRNSNTPSLPHVVLDTEFSMGFTFVPVLCLIQITTRGITAVLDIIALLAENGTGEDGDFVRSCDMRLEKCHPQSSTCALRAFFTWLTGEDHTVVMHSAQNDLRMLYYFSKLTFRNVYCTQKAHQFLKMGELTSLKTLVKDFLGIDIDKSLQQADWLQRPLDESLLRYAANDTILLERVYEKQVESLNAKKKAQLWAQLKNLSNKRYENPWELRIPPLPKAISRTIENEYLWKKLHEWRWKKAKEQDIFPNFIATAQMLQEYILGRSWTTGEKSVSEGASSSKRYKKFVQNLQRDIPLLHLQGDLK